MFIQAKSGCGTCGGQGGGDKPCPECHDLSDNVSGQLGTIPLPRITILPMHSTHHVPATAHIFNTRTARIVTRRNVTNG